MRNETKDKITRTAASVFAERGFESTSVDDIAAAAGIAKGTIYYHFASKEELLLGMLDEGILQFVDTVNERLAGIAGAKAKAVALIDIQVSYFSEHRDFCRVFLSEIWRLESHWKRSVATIQETYLKSITEILSEGMQDGIFRSDLPLPTVTLAFFNLVAISSLDWAVFHSDIPRTQVVETLTAIFLEGTLRPTPHS